MNLLDIIYIVAIVVALFAGYRCGFLERISFTIGIIFGLFKKCIFIFFVKTFLLRHNVVSNIPRRNI